MAAGQISENFNSSAYFWIGRHYWIGLSNFNKPNFEWTDGSPFTFANWTTNQPDNSNKNENCAEIRADGRWNDINCFVNQGWVCKIFKGIIPTSNTIVVPPTFPSNL